MSEVERRIRLVVEYDGTDLCGWQRQDNGPTVQGWLETALAKMVGREIAVVGASRTDAGVHALGQVAAATTESTIPVRGFQRGLNSSLPETICVVGADEVPLEFHPRHHARGKRYRYQIFCRPTRSAPLRHRAWHRPKSLDTDAMRAAAQSLIGQHDFEAFRAADCSANHARRRITSIDISQDNELLTIEICGNAFLRNMVRIICGTLVEIGEGRRPVESTALALASRRRQDAGITAPARGLTLVEVFYDR